MADKNLKPNPTKITSYDRATFYASYKKVSVRRYGGFEVKVWFGMVENLVVEILLGT